MKRKYLITKDELNSLFELCNIDSSIKDDIEFEKCLLELERNIALGSHLNGVLDGRHYLKDDKILIVLGGVKGAIYSPVIRIKPLPFVEDKQKLSDASKKATFFGKINGNISLLIEDMIIDNNSLRILFDNYDIRDINFTNCYFSDNASLGSKEFTNVKFRYCSLPDFNMLSNVNVKEIEIERSTFRNKNSKFNNIKAESLAIKSSNLDYGYLFYYTTLENLKRITVDNKVFKDTDLIMLDKIAPKLRYARLNITLSDLTTFNKINPLPYFCINEKTFEEEITTYKLFDFTPNSIISYKLSNKRNDRDLLIAGINKSIGSIYKNPEYREFKPKDNFVKQNKEHFELCREEFINEVILLNEKYKDFFDIKDITIKHNYNYYDMDLGITLSKLEKELSKTKDTSKREAITLKIEKIKTMLIEYKIIVEKRTLEFEKCFLSDFDTYKENLLNEQMDDEVKKELINITNDITKILSRISFEFYTNNYCSLSHFFLPLYNKIEDMSLYAQICNYHNRDIDGLIKNPLYVEKDVEGMYLKIEEYSNKRKTNFDFFEILSILEPSLAFEFIFKNKNSYRFYDNIRLNNKEIAMVEPAIKSESIADDKLLELVGKEKYMDYYGIQLLNSYTNSNETIEEKTYKKFVAAYVLRKNNSKNRSKCTYNLEYLLNYNETTTEHEEMLSSCNCDRYEEVYRNLQKYKKDSRPEKFRKIYGNNSNYNEEDYSIYLESHRKRNENFVYKKICLSILKENSTKLLNLTPNDYQNLKDFIIANYTKDKRNYYDMDLYYYYELINYVTGNYPPFLSRYISTYEAKPKQKVRIELLNEYRKETNEYMIEEVNKSRTDYQHKQLILDCKNNSFIKY